MKLTYSKFNTITAQNELPWWRFVFSKCFLFINHFCLLCTYIDKRVY